MTEKRKEKNKKMCDTCKDRGTCPFYEAGDDTCIYEVLAKMTERTEIK